jgi:hypothetical protein
MIVGEWHFKVKRTRSGSPLPFLAWCAKTPMLGNSPLDMDFTEREVYFEFGETADEALTKLKKEVLQ